MAKRTLIRNGTVLTMDAELGELATGDVLIDGARIAAVGASLDVGADEVVDATGMLVLPGLIDTHMHLWQTAVRGLAAGTWSREYFSTIHPLSARMRPQDMYASTYGGAVELLAHGVTTVLDFCHSVNSPAHADAAVDALSDSGIRALYGVGLRDRPEVTERAFGSLDDRIRDIGRLHDERQGAGDGRVTIAVALNNPDHVDIETHAREIACARDLGLRATLHSDLGGQIAGAAGHGLLGPDILWVHCVGISDQELALLARDGGTVVVTPEIEAGLMAATPVLGRALRHGADVTLGTDVVSAVGGGVIPQMRAAYSLDRMLDALADRREGRESRRTAWSPTIDAAKLLRLGTVDAARAIGLDDEIGTLTPGKLADVLVLDTAPFGLAAGDPASHVVFQAGRADVEAVFVGGEQRVRAGRLTGVDRARMRDALDSTRDYVLGRSGDVDWPEMDAAARAAYEATLGMPSS